MAETLSTPAPLSCRIPEFWAHVAEHFGLQDDDNWGHAGTREQFAAFAAYLANMDRGSMAPGLKGSHTNVRNLVAGALS